MEPVPDLLVFDWVLALGSTQEAAALLGMPQSSVSRRYRALAERFGISIRRQRGDLFVSSSGTTLRLLRELIQHYRLEKQAYRWAWQPELVPLLQKVGRIGAASTYLQLGDGYWGRRSEFQQARILDLCFEICGDPGVTRVGVINLGIHLHVPYQHPLQSLSEPDRFACSRRYPVKSPTFPLPTELITQLLNDGYQLTSETHREDDLALELRPGQGLDGFCLLLPYRLEAGWRIPPLLDEMVFIPSTLEQCVAPLDLDTPSEPL